MSKSHLEGETRVNVPQPIKWTGQGAISMATYALCAIFPTVTIGVLPRLNDGKPIHNNQIEVF